ESIELLDTASDDQEIDQQQQQPQVDQKKNPWIFLTTYQCPLERDGSVPCPSVQANQCPFGHASSRDPTAAHALLPIPSTICTDYLLGKDCTDISGWPGLVRCKSGLHPTEEQLTGPPEVLDQAEKLVAVLPDLLHLYQREEHEKVGGTTMVAEHSKN